MISRRNYLQNLAAGALSLSANSVWSQEDKSPISIVIGAGASIDVAARLVAEQLRESLGRSVVVLAKLGAGQRIALGEVKRSLPNGRTLLFSTSGPFSIYPNIYNKLEYDPVIDFTPIAGISAFDVAIATGPMTGAKDLKQLIEWTKSKKTGDVVFGSSPGNGSLSHFVGISFGMAADLSLTHVPYKESGVGTIDLATGRLPIMITGVNSFIEMHKAGKIRILAVSGETRTPSIPEVPTLKEAGINLMHTTTTGIFGPAKMPSELVKKLQDAIAPIHANISVKERLSGQSMTMWQSSPSQLAAHLSEERNKFSALVKASGYVKEDA